VILFQDHYIRPLLSIPRVNALYASPIFNCTQIQSLLKKQRDSCSIPQFPYSFGLYKLYSNEADDIEIPLVETECDHTLHFDHCGVFRSLLRFYRAVHLESRGNMNHTSPVPIGDDDLASLLNGTMILHLDGKSTRNGKSEMEAAVIVSSTHVSAEYSTRFQSKSVILNVYAFILLFYVHRKMACSWQWLSHPRGSIRQYWLLTVTSWLEFPAIPLFDFQKLVFPCYL
jgi:hypothetical protein